MYRYTLSLLSSLLEDLSGVHACVREKLMITHNSLMTYVYVLLISLAMSSSSRLQSPKTEWYFIPRVPRLGNCGTTYWGCSSSVVDPDKQVNVHKHLSLHLHI